MHTECHMKCISASHVTLVFASGRLGPKSHTPIGEPGVTSSVSEGQEDEIGRKEKKKRVGGTVNKQPGNKVKFIIRQRIGARGFVSI